jgi:hypothetical protein
MMRKAYFLLRTGTEKDRTCCNVRWRKVSSWDESDRGVSIFLDMTADYN